MEETFQPIDHCKLLGERAPPVRNQKNTSTCTLQAALAAIDILRRIAFPEETQNLSAQYILDHYPMFPRVIRNKKGKTSEEDLSCYEDVLLDSIRDYGVCTEDKYEPFLGKRQKTPSKSVNESDLFKIGGYREIGEDERDIMRALQVGPVLAGMHITRRKFYKLKDKAQTLIFKQKPPSEMKKKTKKKKEPPLHAVVIVGWDRIKRSDGRVLKYFIILNSWGKWGYKGRANILMGSCSRYPDYRPLFEPIQIFLEKGKVGKRLRERGERASSSSLRVAEVAGEYRLLPETLYRTVNYRYLSSNAMNRQRLQLPKVASMMTAARFVSVAQASNNLELPDEAKILKTKKSSSPSSTTGLAAQTLPRFLNSKSSGVAQSKDASFYRVEEEVAPAVVDQCSSSNTFLPARSDDHSVSMDDTVSTHECIDNGDVSVSNSVDRMAFSNLFISDHEPKSVNICNRDAIVDSYTRDVKTVEIDDNGMDPQLCATFACDIYKHLRASEMKKRPSMDFMEDIQTDINENMRAIPIDWLVGVAEYRFVPETSYLTINFVDRYLSGNAMNRQRLQLLGVASMMSASRFVSVAQASNNLEVPSMQLERLAKYIAELSLLEYSMLHYAPSLVAASALFLANFIIDPSNRPLDSTSQHYTLYEPSDISNCVKDLHRLCLNKASDLPAVREKYSQHKVFDEFSVQAFGNEALSGLDTLREFS